MRNTEDRDVLRTMPWMRVDSFRKLSSLDILVIAFLVHPSSAMIGSTSSRSGSMYSGMDARSYRACVRLCPFDVSLNPGEQMKAEVAHTLDVV